MTYITARFGKPTLPVATPKARPVIPAGKTPLQHMRDLARRESHFARKINGAPVYAPATENRLKSSQMLELLKYPQTRAEIMAATGATKFPVAQMLNRLRKEGLAQFDYITRLWSLT